MSIGKEQLWQQQFDWARDSTYQAYNRILGYYQVQACLENTDHWGTMLDFPCGDGTLTEMFLPYFTKVIGVDASAVHLAKAKQRLPDVTFYEALIEDFEINEKFDTIAMLNVLEHVVDPVQVLSKAASHLKEDGVLHVHVPNAYAINRRLAVYMGTLTECEELSPFDIQVAGHRRSYTMETLIGDINAAGLKIKSTGGVFYKMLSTPQMDWFLKNGLWEEGGFGWGRVGGEKKDWKAAFCNACYELGKEHPEECNIIYACITRGK